MADVDAWMPLWIGDYLADTGDLTTEEHGAYLLLLMAMWRQGGRLPGDPDKLARTAKVAPKKWAAIWSGIGRFFDISGESVVQGRLVLELAIANRKHDTFSARGKKGAAAKHATSLLEAENKQQTSKPQAVLTAQPLRSDGDLESGSDSGSVSSGSSQPPDLQGDRPPARDPDPDPNDIRLPPGEVTGWKLTKVFGLVRGRDFPGAFGWTVPKSSPDKAEGIVTDANADPSVRADIVPTMALLFTKAKAGKLAAGADITDPTVAFGWWVSKFTKLREELHGRNTDVPESFEERRNAGPVYPRLT